MITIVARKDKVGWITKGMCWDIRCKSTDTKPISGVPNGSTLIVIDTGDKYMFDADSQQWCELPGSILINADGIYY